jgi:hypothetical protein
VKINNGYLVHTAKFHNYLSYQVTKLYHTITSLDTPNFSMKKFIMRRKYVIISFQHYYISYFGSWAFVFLYIPDF